MAESCRMGWREAVKKAWGRVLGAPSFALFATGGIAHALRSFFFVVPRVGAQMKEARQTAGLPPAPKLK